LHRTSVKILVGDSTQHSEVMRECHDPTAAPFTLELFAACSDADRCSRGGCRPPYDQTPFSTNPFSHPANAYVKGSTFLEAIFVGHLGLSRKGVKILQPGLPTPHVCELPIARKKPCITIVRRSRSQLQTVLGKGTYILGGGGGSNYPFASCRH